MWSQRQNRRSISKRRTTRWWSTREIYWALSSLKGMKSYRFSMRRSRSSNLLLTRERSTTRRGYKRSSASRIKSQSLSVSLLSPKMRQHASLTSVERFCFCKRNCWSSNRRLSSSMTSWKSLWMCTDGANLNALTQKHTSWSRRFNHYRSDWSQRLRKCQKRTSLFRKRRSCTLSSRIFWPNSPAQRSLRNSRFTSRTWRSAPNNSKTWWLS